MSPSPSQRKLRLFIALWPPARAAKLLAQLTQDLHAQWGGRRVARENQHLTLVFLGDVEPARVAGIQEVLTNTAGIPFELQFDVAEYRRNGGLIWVRASNVPEALVNLVDRLRDALRDRGHTVEDRPFVPHVTLLRDARKPAFSGGISLPAWRAPEITLVRSHLANEGVRYEIIGRASFVSGV